MNLPTLHGGTKHDLHECILGIKFRVRNIFGITKTFSFKKYIYNLNRHERINSTWQLIYSSTFSGLIISRSIKFILCKIVVIILICMKVQLLESNLQKNIVFIKIITCVWFHLSYYKNIEFVVYLILHQKISMLYIMHVIYNVIYNAFVVYLILHQKCLFFP
jgi:hypothetical protein